MENKGRKLFWWPNYLMMLSAVMFFVLVIMVFLSYTVQVPFLAPDIVPMPDEGENIPGPEWLFLLFWQGFWSLAGSTKKYLPIMPIIPLVMMVFFIFLPAMHRIPFGRIPGLKGLMEKAKALPSGLRKSFLYAIPTLIFAFVLFAGVYKSGHQAKVLGCDSCHSPAMGPRMAIPPVNVAKYYATDRAQQIGVGKYRAGKISEADSSGDAKPVTGVQEAQGYKDANWQMRHMYEPTFTW
jgi:hypothetical protein